MQSIVLKVRVVLPLGELTEKEHMGPLGGEGVSIGKFYQAMNLVFVYFSEYMLYFSKIF